MKICRNEVNMKQYLNLAFVALFLTSHSVEAMEEDKESLIKNRLVSQNSVKDSEMPGMIGSVAKITVGIFVPYGQEITRITGAIGKSAFGTPTLTEGIIKTGIKYFSAPTEVKKEKNLNFSVEEENSGNFWCNQTSYIDSQNSSLDEKASSYSVEMDSHFLKHFEGEESKNKNECAIANGIYIIKNSGLRDSRDQNRGMLSCSQVASRSGYHVHTLSREGKNYSTERDSYLPDGRYRSNVLWQISKAENGLYTIKNHNYEGGLLTWVGDQTYSGYYAQVLADNQCFIYNYYPNDKDKYSPNGQYRNDVLWQISHLEDGKYIIKNMGAEFNKPDLGLLCYTNKTSSGGNYAQVLHSFKGSHYDKYKEKYNLGGEYRLSILWELYPTIH